MMLLINYFIIDRKFFNRKLLFISLLIILFLFGAVYTYLKSEYNKKLTIFQRGEREGYYWQLELTLIGFYVYEGEFPVGVVYNDYEYNDDFYNYLAREHLIRINRPPVDEFTVKGEKFGELAYYPVYNRNNGKRESFILLSAGIDGKLNNNPTDTLYMDTWWTQLRIYNLQEVMAKAFYKQAYNQLLIKTTERYVYIGDNIDDNAYQNIVSIRPAFSIFQYLWGTKDYVVLYGLPYYVEHGISDFILEKIIKDRNLLDNVLLDGRTLEQWKKFNNE